MTKIKTNRNNTNNVPPLRFPEFSGEWTKYKVSKLLDFYSTNSLSWEQLEYDTNAIQNLHYGLIHVGLPTMVDLNQNKLPNIKEGSALKNYELCKEGDVAFADASEDTNEVAKAIEFFNLDGAEVVCGLHTIHGRDNNGLTVVGFKGYAFGSTAFHNQIRRIAQGTKIYSISTKNFSECYIGVPCKAEQTKIATLLRLIDARISTQNKIIEKLETLIKALSHKLTTQQRPNTRLKDCLTHHSSTLLENDVKGIGQYPVYGATGICGYMDKYEISGDSILIIKDGASVGSTAYATGRYSTIGTLNYLRTTQECYLLPYIYYSLKAFDFRPYITGMAIPHIYFKDYSKAKIWCPAVAEQKRIATTLRTMGTKLQIEHKILRNLILQKQYLLSNLFI